MLRGRRSAVYSLRAEMMSLPLAVACEARIRPRQAASWDDRVVSALKAVARAGIDVCQGQIQDDLLPFISDSRLTGKPATSDLRNGRLTLPVVLAHELGGERDRAVLEDCLSRRGDLAHTFGCCGR